MCGWGRESDAMTASYGVRDIERVLRLSRNQILGLVRSGFVTPSCGPRREYRFTFQDLIVLRLARSLSEARLTRSRIRGALRELRRRLPESVPLSGLRICAHGDTVVVRDGRGHWRADSGQYLLDLEVSVQGGALHVLERSPVTEPKQRHRQSLVRQESETADARAECERRVRENPDDVGAYVSLGRVLHGIGDLEAAERVYRKARETCPPDADLLFSLAVLLEERRRTAEALETYQKALYVNPRLAEAHLRLAQLYERLGYPEHAVHHRGCYRRLTRSEDA